MQSSIFKPKFPGADREKSRKTGLKDVSRYAMMWTWETRAHKGGLPSMAGGADPPDERKEGLPMNVTYSDLIQFCMLIVALVGLCYQIFKGKK